MHFPEADSWINECNGDLSSTDLCTDSDFPNRIWDSYSFAPLIFGKSANSLELRRDHHLAGLADETEFVADPDGS